jgi:hypothetical protein
MGVSEAQAQVLLAQRWFSLSVLTAPIGDLERLARVRARDDVVALAATATTEEEARFLAASVELLARLNVTGVSIARVRAAGTVIGVTAAGDSVVPAPVDYLAWTERVSPFAARSDLRAARRLAGRADGAPAPAGVHGVGVDLSRGGPDGRESLDRGAHDATRRESRARRRPGGAGAGGRGAVT